ncbi:hypothetical protein [Methanopyrus kandleri]|uniref:Uncharacterized protein n=1 Tax=Methanopyrus kandleri (strain AV19 / DSM 6324 / JCM 9639 / NBRC 100938) TaxID=190192 RepID=Q8TW67_METKA|nr:hypothetical protein [Methanopyrus kandleri]AAM02382.1 Uncharacterized protein MK1169 [Methanopyrus kandleri AV19]
MTSLESELREALRERRLRKKWAVVAVVYLAWKMYGKHVSAGDIRDVLESVGYEISEHAVHAYMSGLRGLIGRRKAGRRTLYTVRNEEEMRRRLRDALRGSVGRISSEEKEALIESILGGDRGRRDPEVENLVLIWRRPTAEYRRRIASSVHPGSRLREIPGVFGTFEGIWGFGSGERVGWESLGEGDVLLFRDEKGEDRYRYCGVIASKCNDPKVSAILWGDDRWERLVTLAEVRLVSLPASELNELLGYRAGFRPRGAMRVDPDRVSKLVERYGGVLEFLREYEE